VNRPDNTWLLLIHSRYLGYLTARQIRSIYHEYSSTITSIQSSTRTVFITKLVKEPSVHNKPKTYPQQQTTKSKWSPEQNKIHSRYHFLVNRPDNTWLLLIHSRYLGYLTARQIRSIYHEYSSIWYMVYWFKKNINTYFLLKNKFCFFSDLMYCSLTQPMTLSYMYIFIKRGL
jgi:hypothetical protein